MKEWNSSCDIIEYKDQTKRQKKKTKKQNKKQNKTTTPQ